MKKTKPQKNTPKKKQEEKEEEEEEETTTLITRWRQIENPKEKMRTYKNKNKNRKLK